MFAKWVLGKQVWGGFKPVLLLDPKLFGSSVFPPNHQNPTSPGPQVNEAKAKRVRSTAKGGFCVGDSGVWISGEYGEMIGGISNLRKG